MFECIWIPLRKTLKSVRVWLLAATSSGVVLWGGNALAQGAAFTNTMAERTRACTACHGEQGRAGPDGYYPRLAGKPAGYLLNQLKNFAQGRRHYDLMTRLVEPLSDAYLEEIAKYFSELKIPYPPASQPSARLSPSVLERGKALALNGDASLQVPACVQCHGQALMGNAAHVPGLLGLPLDYLSAQLGAWQTHQRRARAPDCMAQVVARLNSADLIAVATWLSTQNPGRHNQPASLVKPSMPTPNKALSAEWACGSALELSSTGT